MQCSGTLQPMQTCTCCAECASIPSLQAYSLMHQTVLEHALYECWLGITCLALQQSIILLVPPTLATYVALVPIICALCICTSFGLLLPHQELKLYYTRRTPSALLGLPLLPYSIWCWSIYLILSGLYTSNFPAGSGRFCWKQQVITPGSHSDSSSSPVFPPDVFGLSVGGRTSKPYFP